MLLKANPEQQMSLPTYSYSCLYAAKLDHIFISNVLAMLRHSILFH